MHYETFLEAVGLASQYQDRPPSRVARARRVYKEYLRAHQSDLEGLIYLGRTCTYMEAVLVGVRERMEGKPRMVVEDFDAKLFPPPLGPTESGKWRQTEQANATPPVPQEPPAQAVEESGVKIERLRPALDRILEHLEYLREVSLKSPNPPITLETAADAWTAWTQVWEATGFALPVPAACTGPDGKLLYTWDRGRHHLELEIIPGQAAEFFYRDRETGELWGEDYRIGDQVPLEAIQKLRVFV